MTQIPDHLSFRGNSGSQHREEAGPVIEARRPLDQMPAQGIPHRPYSHFGEQTVVGLGLNIMSRRVNHIDSSMWPLMGGALEAAHEEAVQEVIHQRIRVPIQYL